jgi:beta-N-acetylhexosaminidase|tara:strand:+ start:732 stop:1685 length:954 start_codon:yes stop_codon:yes gene_type:complete
MKINSRKSFICAIKSTKLSIKEHLFIKKHRPWGIILFQRNIKNIDQAKILTSSIRKLFDDPYYPILIDEEGGRVSRLKKIVDNSIFSGKFFGDLYKKNIKKFNLYYKIYVDQISYVLNLIGANINTVPILDLRRNSSHNIIGDRAYSNNKKIISKIGNISINLFHQNRIGTVIKHVPGHGLAKQDSHLNLPYINKKLRFLEKNDFYIFKNKKSIFAMTAHIVFKPIDKNNCITHSKIGIKYIRNNIGFRNLIISDDISMKALQYSFNENVKKAYKAGCNLVLHCNGNLIEMNKLAAIAPKIDRFIIKKTSEFYKLLS